MAKLSDLATYMLNYHGMARLTMMKAEYEAGLPLGMPAIERLARVEAINEVLNHKAAPVKIPAGNRKKK